MNKLNNTSPMKNIEISPTFGNLQQFTPVETTNRNPFNTNSNLHLNLPISKVVMGKTRETNVNVMSNLLKLAKYSDAQNRRTINNNNLEQKTTDNITPKLIDKVKIKNIKIKEEANKIKNLGIHIQYTSTQTNVISS